MKKTITFNQLKEAVEDLGAGASYDEIDQQLSNADYETFCKQLSFLVNSSDPKSQALYDTFKNGWKDEYKDITVKAEFVPIRDLHPTQNVIFANKSLAPMLDGTWQIGGKPAVEVVLSDSSVEVPLQDPLVVCNVGNVNYLIDGHHRWSKFYAFNPTCKMQAWVITSKSGAGMFKDSDEVLKFAQGTLAALGQDTINPQSKSDVNMYEINLEWLRKLVEAKTSPEILQIAINSPVTKGLITDKQSLARYLWQNLVVNMYQRAPAGEHDREFMPQYPSKVNPEQAVDMISENSKVTLTLRQLKKLVREARLNWKGPKVLKRNWDGYNGSVTFRLGKIFDEKYYQYQSRRSPVDITMETEMGHFFVMGEIGNANATSFNRAGQCVDDIADHNGYIYKQLPAASQELLDKIADWWRKYHLVNLDDIPEADYDAISEMIEYAKEYEVQ